MTRKDLVADKLDAQFREADARLDALEAQARARRAKEEMAEIAGLRTVRESARQKLASMKRQGEQTFDASKRAVEAVLHDFTAGIERVSARYAAWDEARERSFHALLNEADAKLRVWKTRADQTESRHTLKRHEELVELEERAALAKAKAAEWEHARHDRKAQEAIEEAARHFNEAFDAAARRYHS
jgi:hypothetical protein